MPSEVDFAPEEWALLTELPFKAVLAAICADVRGPVGGAGKETVLAARRLVREATSTYPDNALIMGVLQTVAGDDADEADIKLKDDQARLAAITEATALGARANALLANHDGGAETAQYKQWVFDGARAAVNATKSGGFLGFGASRVSDDEAAFLQELATALDVPAEE